jgi:hypothetical protein
VNNHSLHRNLYNSHSLYNAWRRLRTVIPTKRMIEGDVGRTNRISVFTTTDLCKHLLLNAIQRGIHLIQVCAEGNRCKPCGNPRPVLKLQKRNQPMGLCFKGVGCKPELDFLGLFALGREIPQFIKTTVGSVVIVSMSNAPLEPIHMMNVYNLITLMKGIPIVTIFLLTGYCLKNLKTGAANSIAQDHEMLRNLTGH